MIEQFRRFGVTCEQSAKPKSDLYQDMLALFNSRRIELLDNPRLISQLTALERRTARGGRDSIDHAPGAHDDLANAVAGVASGCLINPVSEYRRFLHAACGDDDDPCGRKAWQRAQLVEHVRRHRRPFHL